MTPGERSDPSLWGEESRPGEGGLDADAPLPDKLMPPEYWDYLKRKYPVKETTGD
jgi:hypothetical protein